MTENIDERKLVQLLNTQLVNFSDIEDITGFALLICQSASYGGLFLGDNRNRLFLKQVRKAAKEWVQSVRRRIDKMPISDALTVINIFAPVHRIAYGSPADSVFINIYTLAAFDSYTRTDKTEPEDKPATVTAASFRDKPTTATAALLRDKSAATTAVSLKDESTAVTEPILRDKSAATTAASLKDESTAVTEPMLRDKSAADIKTVDPYTLFWQIKLGLNRKDRAYFFRPLQWYTASLDRWYNDFFKGTYSKEISTYDTIQRISILLQTDLRPYKLLDQDAFKQDLFNTHRYLFDNLSTYDLSTLKALYGLLTSSLPYLSEDDFDSYLHTLLETINAQENVNRFYSVTLYFQKLV